MGGVGGGGGAKGLFVQPLIMKNTGFYPEKYVFHLISFFNWNIQTNMEGLATPNVLPHPGRRNPMKSDSGKRIMAQEIFDAMVDGAIEDLRKSGLPSSDVYRIVEDHFGERYAQAFCDMPP